MKHSILFVDDERGIRQYCKEELEESGFCVVLARDGDDAVDLLESRSVDLVIMDEHMPCCSGLEAAQHIKRLYPRLPLILFTHDPDYETYRSPFVDASIIKSANLGALKRAIAGLLPATHARNAGTSRSVSA